MRLFDDIAQKNFAPKGYAQPEFDYHNTSGRAEYAHIRELLESWFSRYPVEAAKDLRSRFRSEVDNAHRGAFFELLTHELLLKLGCDVVVHPEVGNQSTRRPDFRANREHETFLVEARVTTHVSEAEAKAAARRNEFYDVLDRTLDSPDFFICLRMRGAPNRAPSAKSMRMFLESRLRGLDPDVVEAELRRGEERTWPYERDGWQIDFFPIPKGPESRGRPGVRPLGLFAPEPLVQRLDPVTPIRRAIEKKAGSYGDLDLPYVIALNTLGEFSSREHVLEALYGGEVLVHSRYDDGTTDMRFERNPDGAFVGVDGKRNTRVSAVLMFDGVRPRNLSSASVELYPNYFTGIPYQGVLEQFPRVELDEIRDSFVPTPGRSLCETLGLPHDWP
jgi:hypothetical protein